MPLNEGQPNRKKRLRVRRALRWLGWLALAALVVAASLPFWFPLVLKLALGPLGAEAVQVQRVGYSKILVQEVRLRTDTIEFTARELRVPQPGTWLRHRWFGSSSATPALVGVQGWNLTVRESAPDPSSPAAKPPGRVGAVLDDLTSLVPSLIEWLPPIDGQDGAISIEGEALIVPSLTWRAGRLSAEFKSSRLGLEATTVVQAESGGRFLLELREPSHEVEWKASLAAEGSDWELVSEGAWQSNRFTLQARQGRGTDGPWPDRVDFNAPAIRLSAAALGLPGYSDLVGQVHLTGQRDQFALRAGAAAEPAAPDWPPVRLELEARLNPDAILVDRLECRSAPLDLTLSSPVTWFWATRKLDGAGHLSARLNFAAQHWVDARGAGQGTITLTPREGLEPLAEFRFAGQDLEIHGVPTRAVELSGRASGLIIERLELQASLTNGSVLTATAAGLNLSNQTLTRAEAAVSLRPGAPFLNPLPFSFQEAQATGVFQGALTNLQHRGAATVLGVKVDGMRPAKVESQWEGSPERHLQVQARLTTDHGEIELAGSLDQLVQATLDKLVVRSQEGDPLQLAAPVSVRFQAPTSTHVTSRWELSSTRLTLTNAHQHLAMEGSVQWPTKFRGALSATNLEARFLHAFLERDLPKAGFSSIALQVECDDGPATFRLGGAGWFEAGTNAVIQAEGTLEGNGEAMRVTGLRLREGGVEAVQVQGTLPLVVGLLGDGRWWAMRPEQSADVEFALAPTPSLQRWLQGRTGLQLVGRTVTGRAFGSLRAPQGQLRVSADAVEPRAGSPLAGRLPRMEGLDVSLRLQTNSVVVGSLALSLEGTPLAASGTLPLGSAFWTDAVAGRVNVDLARLSARLDLPWLPLASVELHLGSWLRPEGRFRAAVELRPGWRWGGELEVEGMETHPLPWLGSLRSGHGRIVLDDQRARVETVEAELGGSIARVSGWMDLPTGRPGSAAGPAFDLQLTGANLPLARQAGLIVRGDLDLHLRHAGTNTPSIEGQVKLGRSYVLSDLQALFGGAVRTVNRPPPFFSVEAEPFAAWRLGVEIQGDEFLRIKSPFYTGLHSVNLKLRGTLREPLLLGDAQVVRGTVIFPYASLPVRPGLITFTEKDPAHPRLQVRAAGRAFGHDLRIDISGSPAEPVVQFHSSPPLTSEEILLMVTAGELPRNQLTYSTANRLTKLAAILGRDLMNQLGSPETQEARLIIRSGEGLASSGRVTHYVEFRLSNAWSLVGEYDEFDAVNAGVKWRVLQR